MCQMREAVMEGKEMRWEWRGKEGEAVSATRSI